MIYKDKYKGRIHIKYKKGVLVSVKNHDQNDMILWDALKHSIPFYENEIDNEIFIKK